MNSGIDPGLSDHNFITLDLELSSESRGPGLWRFNNKLLEDSVFVEDVYAEINKARNELGQYTNVASIGLLSEMLLSSIRVIAIKSNKK